MKKFITELTFNARRPEPAGVLVSEMLRDYKIVRTRMEGFKDHDYLDSAYLMMANCVGPMVGMEENLATGDKTGDLLTEIKTDPDHPTSYRHATVAQPLHTDGSYEANAPDVSFFYCKRKAEYGGATIFVDSRDVFDMALAENMRMAMALTDEKVTFEKGSDSKTRTIVSSQNFLMAWNYHRVKNQTDLTFWFHKFLEEKVVKGGVCYPILLEEGEAVFFRDEELLHGRYGYIGKRFLVKGGIRHK